MLSLICTPKEGTHMRIQNSLFTTALLGASLASATLLVEETFDYTIDSNIGGVAATGTGLTGN